MNSPESATSSPTCTTTSEDSTPSDPTKSTSCSEMSLHSSESTPRQVHNPEGVTEPPPPGYRLAYSDEVQQEFEGRGWLFYSLGDVWTPCYVPSEGDQPSYLVPHWSYAVPVDWVRPKTKTELDLHVEIAALRAEIAELKRHLNPPVG